MKTPRHPNSLKNLKPYKPGDEWTGNAGGRPKKRPITDRYFRDAEKPMPEKLRLKFNKEVGVEVLLPGATWGDADSIQQHIQAALKGVTAAAKEIRESIEGKAPERLEITGPERKEIVIRLIHDRTKR